VRTLTSTIGTNGSRNPGDGGGGGGGGGGEPPANMIASFDGDDVARGTAGQNGWWVINGSIGNYSIFSSPPPAWNAISYANATSGHTYDFTGTEYIIGPTLDNFGQTTAFTVNLWFYPTSYDCQLVSEYETRDPGSAYHYSMLELDSSGYVLARAWPNNAAARLSSQVTVNLNAWNHIHYRGNISGFYELNVNNNPYVFGTLTPRSGPTNSVFAFGVQDITNIATTNRFQGKIGYFGYQNDSAGASMWNVLAPRYGL